MGRQAAEVRGTKPFAEKLNSLKRDSELWRSVDDCLGKLKSDALAGIKIPRNLWPARYARGYRLTNLYKCNLTGAHRLLYTIYANEGKLTVLAIDFMSHKEYEKLFGY